MAKDPAMLFYSADFMMGAMVLSMEERGQYITLLCIMHQQGRLSVEQMEIVLNCKVSENILKKFQKDSENRYYNERLETEKEKRKEFTSSRRKSLDINNGDMVHLYVVKAPHIDLYKIGSSKYPELRLKEIVKYKPGASFFWISTDLHCRSNEKALHERFSEKREKYDWFWLSKDDLKAIKDEFKSIQNTEENEHSEDSKSLESFRTENENENRNKEYLIPSLLKIWQAKNPNYPKDDHRDFEPLRKIAEFIAGQNNLSIENKNHHPAISEKFEKVCGVVVSDKFWNNKPLISIEGRIQEFYSKAIQSTTLKRFSGIV